MLLTIDIETKTIGTKELFHGLHLSIAPHHKVAVIGRNGVGKTTLFNILSGQDTDFIGMLQLKRGTRLVSTAQEHHNVEQQSVIEYVLQNLPEYSRLKYILDSYPDIMGQDMKKIQTYSESLKRFSDLGYFQIEEKIIRSLQSYQITTTMALGRIAQLSGGQKRFVELVRVEHADADIILIDEPTNHMDYVAKDAFIAWLQAAKQAVLVITHDRDVLQNVDSIIEIGDGNAHVFQGNYEAYLKQNTVTTTEQIHNYEVALKTLENLYKKILWARARKASWHGTADQRNPFEVMERRLLKEYDETKRANPRPRFWIDRESAESLSQKVGASYEKFKAKNIRIGHATADRHSTELVAAENLSLGYMNQPLFGPINFRLQSGERLRLVGRNGAGKTTLIRAITTASRQADVSTLIHGKIICNKKLRLSVYEQEIEPEFLKLTVTETIEQIYNNADRSINAEAIKRIMSDYLFDPHEDAQLRVKELSGGQKARLQIIRMLANSPNMLVLDEPTNHLDLPSIEELENMLTKYPGAVLYVTHDSYFAKSLEGAQLVLQKD